jgi:hypothetical protein
VVFAPLSAPSKKVTLSSSAAFFPKTDRKLLMTWALIELQRLIVVYKKVLN